MKKIIILLLIIFTFFGSNVVYAKYGLDKTAKKAGLGTAVRGGSLPDIIGSVVGAALTMVGVLFLLLMIYGGIIWMIARGNEQQTDKALNTIKAAVIGLIIVVASYAITTFVFNAISGNETTTTSSSSSTCEPGLFCVDDTQCGNGECSLLTVSTCDGGLLDGENCTEDAQCDLSNDGSSVCLLEILQASCSCNN